jgi:hypothetical protein
MTTAAAQPEPLAAALDEEQMLRRGLIPTDVKPAVAWAMIGVFLLLIVGVPLFQACSELIAGCKPQALDIFSLSLKKSSLHGWEETLEKSSIPRTLTQPRLQELMSSLGGFGNTSAVVGRDGWMFYQPGLDYLGGPGVLDPTRLQYRDPKTLVGVEPRHPDSRPAILRFHEFCKAQGIHLIVMPIPDKAMLQPMNLLRRFDGVVGMEPLNNPDFAEWASSLRRQGVDVFDCTPAAISPTDRRFMIQDTHWTPRWMQSVAGELAGYLRAKLGPSRSLSLHFRIEERSIERVGDLVDMLSLGEGQRAFPPQRVSIRRVLDSKARPWAPDPKADLLFMGDSFANIYSLESMGWGDSAGFVEHLGYALGSGVDRITRNDAGAYATRQMLAAELARGRDRLAGKKVVVWEFAVRELTHGDWKTIAMKLGSPPQRKFLVPAAGEKRNVTGTVAAAAPAPQPGKVPYRDHIVAVHLVDLEDDHGPIPGGEALVYMWSMRNNVLTHAARYRPDQKIHVNLRPWSDVSNKLDAINRQELDDEELNPQEPCWGEEIQP